MKTKVDVTSADVERSYLILALLEVTRDAADYLNEQGDAVNRMGSIVATLRHISDLHGELHDALERATRKSDGEAE